MNHIGLAQATAREAEQSTTKAAVQAVKTLSIIHIHLGIMSLRRDDTPYLINTP
jgi:hypothetical protein